MVRQASSIVFILITSLYTLFNKANCKSGGGHYSSQRSLGSGSSGGYGLSAGNQQNFLSNSWFPQDMNLWYDYGKFVPLLIFIIIENSLSTNIVLLIIF